MTTSTTIEAFWTIEGDLWGALIVNPPEDFNPPLRATFIRLAREQAKAIGFDIDFYYPADGEFPDVETHWIVRMSVDPDDPTQFQDDADGERIWWATEGFPGAVPAIGLRFEI